MVCPTVPARRIGLSILTAAMLAGALPATPAFGENLPPLPTLQRSPLSLWTDGAKAYHVAGEITNGDGTQSGRFIRVQCTIHDQTKVGNPAVTTFAYAEADILKPGEKSPFEVVFFPAPATHDDASCTVSGSVSHAVPNHDFAVAITSVTIAPNGLQQISGTVTNNRNATVGPVKLMLTHYSSPAPGLPVDETSHYLATNASSSLEPLQQVAFTFDRVTPPNGPAWSYAGNASIAWLAEAPAPTTDLTPSPLAFAPQIDAIPSAPRTLTVSNIGTGDLHVGSIGLDNLRDYQVAADRCTGATVAAGLSCGVDIIFDPLVLGPTQAIFTVVDDAPGSHTATITGTGLSRTDGRLSPGKLTFAEQGVTTSSPPQTVTLTSIGPDPLGQISVAVSPNFAIAADACSATTVAVGSTCTIGVSFVPSTTGPLTGWLTVSDNGRSNPHRVSLTGTGSLLAVTISPSIVDYGSLLLGTTSAPSTVSMTNVGSASAQLGAVTLSGVNGADFATSWDGCSGALLGPKDSCYVAIRFTPSAAGSRTGVLNFPVTGRTVPLTVLLMGSGLYPTPPPLNGGAYHPLDPVRILDTRSGPTPVGLGLGAVAGGQTIDVQVTGRGNVPTDGVSAVVVNVTVTGTTGSGYLTIFPTPFAPADPPLASNLNWTAGKTIPNLVEVGVGANGQISIFNGVGSAAHVIVDVEGYVGVPTTTPGRDGRFVPTVPARVLDTRSGPAPANGGLGPVAGGTSINVKVLGAGGVPATGVAAVVLNVTVTGPTSEGFLTVYPAGLQQVPLASNLNFQAGQTVPNRVIARVGANGAISIYNGYGLAHVVVDVNGWFSDDTNWQLTGSGFKATLLPTRILDTRSGTADLGSPIGAMGPASTMSLPVAGRGTVPGMTSQKPPTAVVLNVTVTNPTVGDHLTIWPGLVDGPPLASDLNFVAGQTVPNLVVVKVGTDGTIQFYNGSGFTDVVADVVGWYS
ncbi:MAG: choice-of-anchor D domain-containing protein [Candidatus Dormibacteraeota bacterium]|nr:choice-of-anchor D domain-containing protein [Candidatus Dormibacteraeota bacterium]